jgi:hypothetical protein
VNDIIPAITAITDGGAAVHQPLMSAYVEFVDWRPFATVIGFALLVWMLLPARHARAVDAIAQRPLRGLLAGLLMLIVPLAALFALRHLGIAPGRGLALLVLALALAAGLGVSARALGQRIWEDASPLCQAAVGAAALLLPLATPLGVPVALLAGILGLGAWLRPLSVLPTESSSS